jgi:hypothetical protein
MPPTEQAWRHRLNGFGSSYYFTKVLLKRKRLTPHLHLPICLSLEKLHLKDVKEYPRDHFKTSIACEGMPIWRVLPFGDQDEAQFRFYNSTGEFDCGAIDEFIKWMRLVHNPYLRNLIVSENLENARKIGTRIRRHFESNAVFRTMYPEILPTTSEKWTDSSLQIHMPNGQSPDPHGEGTFDFTGVGGALQSRHYNGLLLQDDLVGRKAIESQSVMDKTIEYHQLLVGVFDNDDANHESDELVIGNRWGFQDVNSHIREHEPWFQIESHSALGGCCDLHPPGVPIFPEEFSIAKLEKLKRRLGSYKFSCQFLNDPSSPEDADFQESWLNYFEVKADVNHDQYISHEVKDGVVRKNIWGKNLRLAMATDPTHSQNRGSGRCRHAIVVWGMSDAGDYYLMDAWAKTCSYEEYFIKLLEVAMKWGLHRVGFETSAGQGLGAFHLEYYSNLKGWRLKIVELKGEVELEDGSLSTKKQWRIKDVLGPLGEFGRIFVQRRFQDFIGEWSRFPRGTFVDMLDASAYIPQMLRSALNTGSRRQLREYNKQMSKLVGQPYSVGTGQRIYTPNFGKTYNA